VNSKLGSLVRTVLRNISLNTVMRRLTTAISSEICVVSRFRRCAEVIVCSYKKNR